MYNNQRSKQIIERDYTIGIHQSGPSNRFQIPKRGLVGEWLLNGDATDSFGINNGTPTNMAWVDSGVGYTKQAGSFNGTTSYIQITNTFLASYTSVTWGAWIKTSTSNADMEIMTSNNVNAVYTLRVINGGKLQWRLFAGGSHTSVLPTNVVSDGLWHQIIGTRDGSNMYLYLDGVQIGTTAKSGTIGTLDSNMRIGSYPTGVQFFNGEIKICRVLNIALNNKEIIRTYKEGLKLLH